MGSCGIFVNLPWFFRETMVKKLKEILADAEAKGMRVDVVCFQKAKVHRKKRWFKELNAMCRESCTFRESFENKFGEKVAKQTFFCGYLSSHNDADLSSV